MASRRRCDYRGWLSSLVGEGFRSFHAKSKLRTTGSSDTANDFQHYGHDSHWQKEWDVPMNKFVVITFTDAAKIHYGTSALKKMHAEGGVKLYASAVVAKDLSGGLSVQEVTKERLGGTAVGALLGGLAGLPLGPLAMTIGAAGGALIGNSADLLNQGDEAEFAERISRELAPGKAVIVADVDEDGLISLATVMQAIGGTVVCK